MADDVAVMYAGQIVERAPVRDLFARPEHPYTVGLLGSIPRLDEKRERLPSIEGRVPDMTRPPEGCRFAARCPFVEPACRAAAPPLIEVAPGHLTRCRRAPLAEVLSIVQ
jgi:peptide/nickel transport system ATP-binding protein